MSILFSLLACKSDFALKDYYEPTPPFSSEELVSACEPPIEEVTPIDLTTTPPQLNADDFEFLNAAHDRWIDEVEAQLPDGKTYQDLLDGKVSYHLAVEHDEWGSVIKFNAGSAFDESLLGTPQQMKLFGCRVDPVFSSYGDLGNVEQSMSRFNAGDYVITAWRSPVSDPAGNPIIYTELETPEEYVVSCYWNDMGIGPNLGCHETGGDRSDYRVDCHPATDSCLSSSTNLGPSTDSSTVSGGIRSLAEDLAVAGGKFFYDADGENNP